MSLFPRRKFILVAVAFCTVRSLPACAQAPQLAKAGFLFTPSRATSQVPGLFSAAMSAAGWVEGRNLTMEWRFADGQLDRLPDLATQLVRQGVQVIVAPTNLEAEVARRATDSIPIVMLFATDPVGSGFAGSLVRPGKNITGVMYADPNFGAKSVQLLKEVAPAIRRLGYLYPTAARSQGVIEEMEAAARTMGLAFHSYGIERPEEIATVLERMKKDGVDALRVAYAGPVQAVTGQLLAFASSNRIATLFSVPTAVERGGLMSYSPKLAESAVLGAAIVDKILKGAHAAELAFEYPTRYELTMNLGTAKQLGISLPQSILLRADRLVE